MGRTSASTRRGRGASCCRGSTRSVRRDAQAAEIERLILLGARRVDWDGYPPDADYVVLEDPEDTRFCVIDATPPRS